MKKLLYIFLLVSGVVFAQDKEAIKDIKNHQDTQNKKFKTEGDSPLTDKDRKTFKGLDFYPIDLDYRVEAQFKRTPNERPFAVGTSSGQTKYLIKYGEVHFTIKGQKAKLAVYQSQRLLQMPQYKEYLFLPFTDATTGTTSYGGGRFMDLTIPKGNTILLDFNKAYNPYCAYSDGWNCTIPPAENSLDIAIKAGVKTYKDH